MSRGPYSVWQAPGQPVVVTLPRELDLINSSVVHAALMRALQPGGPAVIADMTATLSCSLAAALALGSFAATATAAGTELRIVSAVLPVRRVLAAASGERPWRLYPGLAEAFAGQPGSGGGNRTIPPLALTAGSRPAANRDRLRLIPGGAAGGSPAARPQLRLVGARQESQAAPDPGRGDAVPSGGAHDR